MVGPWRRPEVGLTGQQEGSGVEAEYGRRGVKTKLIGVVLMALGFLDSLLTLRGGIPAYEYLLLIFFGACVFAVGAVRGQRRPPVEG